MVRHMMIIGLFFALCNASNSKTIQVSLKEKSYKFAVTGEELFLHDKATDNTDVNDATCPAKLAMFCKPNQSEGNHEPICVDRALIQDEEKTYVFSGLQDNDILYSCKKATNQVNLPVEAFDIMISPEMKAAKEHLNLVDNDTAIFCIVAGCSSHAHNYPTNAENKDNTADECSSKNKKVHYFQVSQFPEEGKKIKFTAKKLAMNKKLNYGLFACGTVKEIQKAKKKYDESQKPWYKKIGHVVVIVVCILLIVFLFWIMFQEEEEDDEFDEKKETYNPGSNNV